jgi:catechol 2,3-dioxygenase-like lactoylglutathione lyase family enzyme
MNIRLVHITFLVDDYDKAIDFFTRKLNFKLVEDTKLSDEKRWVLVTPQGSGNCCLLLAKASNDEQKKSIGNQSGGRVFLFLQTDNFTRDYQNLIDNGIKIVREPKSEDYGTVLVFEDLYGNLWDLIEPSKSNPDN